MALTGHGSEQDQLLGCKVMGNLGKGGVQPHPRPYACLCAVTVWPPYKKEVLGATQK